MAKLCIMRRWAIYSLDWDDERIYSALRGVAYYRLNLVEEELKNNCLRSALQELDMWDRCMSFYRTYKRTKQSEEDEITIQKTLCIVYFRGAYVRYNQMNDLPKMLLGSQEYINCEHYITVLNNLWKTNQRVLFELSTNSGKSSLAVFIAKNQRTLIIAPYRTIVKMYVNKGIPEIKGDEAFTQSSVCTTDWYAYHGKSIPSDVVIIIDESHLLSLEDYRSVRTEAVSLLNSVPNKQFYMTATMENEPKIISGISCYSAIKKRGDRMNVLYGETQNFSKCAYVIAKHFTARDERIVIVSDCSWKKIYNHLTAEGVVKDDITVITANHIKGVTDGDAFNRNDAKEVLEWEQLTRKWTIMTRVAYAGVNFQNNKKTLLIVELDEAETTGSYLVQAAGRVRDGEISVVALWNKKFKREDPKKWQSLYNLVETGNVYAYEKTNARIPFNEYTKEVMEENVKTMNYKIGNATLNLVSNYFMHHQHLGGGSFYQVNKVDLLTNLGHYDFRITSNLQEEQWEFSQQIRDAAKEDMDEWLDDRCENNVYIPVWKNTLIDIENDLKKEGHSVNWVSWAEYIYAEVHGRHRGVKSVMEDLKIITSMTIHYNMLCKCLSDEGALEVAKARGDKKPETMAKRLKKLANLLLVDGSPMQWNPAGVTLNVKTISEKRSEAGKKGGKKTLAFLFKINDKWLYDSEHKETRRKRMYAMWEDMDDQMWVELFGPNGVLTHGKKEAETFLTGLKFGSKAIRRLFETPKEKYSIKQIEKGNEVVCWFDVSVKTSDGKIISIDEWIKDKARKKRMKEDAKHTFRYAV